MIRLSAKDEFRRILMTLNAGNLEYIGPFQFITSEKKIIKPKDAEVPRHCLYLTTQSGEYASTVTVSKANYERAKVDEPYGLCGVIKNPYHSDFILITEKTEPEAAIRQAVKRAWGEMFFFLFVCCLFLFSVLLLLIPLLR